ncbi:sulfotransferase [Shewanella marinintestina]|uniref:sulfotransferase family protein n=1 Tax=Shewanella marinintestina TaxID=190305 RepID=UPI00200BB98C|nr:sulfotransferase [Shewanella marinintestina]MCL1144809.1 sulfotransferase [Shewanella marinintestina]
MKNNCFDRPIIILSAPRSGSTLLYEVLSKNSHLLSIGGESHAIIESIPGLNIASKNFESNALTADDATPIITEMLYSGFKKNLQSSTGSKISPVDKVRFLEKTPKNSLRIDFINQLFPDALFVYLVRDPKENISSIMEAWRSNRFRTYPGLPGWNGDWSLLLPKNWKQLLGQPLQNIAAFQWCEANESIISSLQKLPKERWKIVHYENLINDTTTTLKSICNFAQIPFDQQLQQACSQPLPHSQFTLSAPKKNKWLSNYQEVHSVWPRVMPTLQRINSLLSQDKQLLLAEEWQQLQAQSSIQKSANTVINHNKVPRNADCPCGSKKRFKHCHGQLS